MVSRARNSGSDWYHAVAAVFSNGVWFAATFITIDLVTDILSSGSVAHGVAIGVIYVAFTVTGSVVAGKLLRTYVEKGKRRVGHYDKPDTTTTAAPPAQRPTVTPEVRAKMVSYAEGLGMLAGSMKSLAETVKRDRFVLRVIADKLDNLNERMKRAESSIMDIADVWHASHKLDDEEDERLESYEQLRQ
jgi:hypothetical protein